MPLRPLEPPEAVRTAAAAQVHQLATPRGIFPALRDVVRENLALVAPHRMYTLGADAIVSDGLSAVVPAGWRFLVADGDRVVASAEASGMTPARRRPSTAGPTSPRRRPRSTSWSGSLRSCRATTSFGCSRCRRCTSLRPGSWAITTRSCRSRRRRAFSRRAGPTRRQSSSELSRGRRRRSCHELTRSWGRSRPSLDDWRDDVPKW